MHWSRSYSLINQIGLLCRIVLLRLIRVTCRVTCSAHLVLVKTVCITYTAACVKFLSENIVNCRISKFAFKVIAVYIRACLQAQSPLIGYVLASYHVTCSADSFTLSWGYRFTVKWNSLWWVWKWHSTYLRFGRVVDCPIKMSRFYSRLSRIGLHVLLANLFDP